MAQPVVTGGCACSGAIRAIHAPVTRGTQLADAAAVRTSAIYARLKSILASIDAPALLECPADICAGADACQAVRVSLAGLA